MAKAINEKRTLLLLLLLLGRRRKRRGRREIRRLTDQHGGILRWLGETNGQIDPFDNLEDLPETTRFHLPRFSPLGPKNDFLCPTTKCQGDNELNIDRSRSQHWFGRLSYSSNCQSLCTDTIEQSTKRQLVFPSHEIFDFLLRI